MDAPDRRREADIGQRCVVKLFESFAVAADKCSQRGGRSRRNWEQVLPRRGASRLWLRRSFFQDDMRIGAADPMELTPARRGCSARDQSCKEVFT